MKLKISVTEPPKPNIASNKLYEEHTLTGRYYSPGVQSYTAQAEIIDAITALQPLPTADGWRIAWECSPDEVPSIAFPKLKFKTESEAWEYIRSIQIDLPQLSR